MENVMEPLADQERWDTYGDQQIRDMKCTPEQYIIRNSPIEHWSFYAELMALLEPLPGKTILDVGCGLGEFAVFLAKQGAHVSGIDIGANLIAAAKTLADINQVPCDFRQESIVKLPFERETFDTVLGMGILHHLSPENVVKALREVSRVLKADGTAVFYEPVENSKLFSFVQELFPKGTKGESDYRPSRLRKAAWKEYVQTLDDRPMTNRELSSAGKGLFQSIRFQAFGFLFARLQSLIGRKHERAFQTIDKYCFKIFPFFKRYCQIVLVEYRK